MTRFDGRVALVTGAGSDRGIGFASATILAERGAQVMISSTTNRIQTRVAELRSAGHDAAGFAADLTEVAQAQALVDAALEAFGRLDVVVNNAGMVQVGTPDDSRAFIDTPPEAWERSIAMNLTTTVNVTRAALPHLLAAGYGRIVNVSSVTGPMVTNPESSGYSAAKSGVDGLTRALAVELGPAGITVNSVAPGWIDTGSSTEEERIAGLHTPVGRCGTPREVAELVAFLASEGASYVTGTSVPVDGANILQEMKGS